MLGKLDKYLMVAIVSSSMVVLLALQSIAILIEMISAIDDLGKQSYTISVLILYVLGYSSDKIIQFFPMSLLLGALLGLGRVAATNELTVMQFFGISKLRVGGIGFFVSMVLGAGVLLANEFAFIPAYEKAVQLRQTALNLVSEEKGYHGFWAQNNNSFINVSGVRTDGRLSGVTIYTVDEQMKIQSIKRAESAAFSSTQASGWDLFNLSETIFKQGRLASLETAHYPTLFWDNTLDKSTIELLLSPPDELATLELYRYVQYQESNGIESTVYALALWQRLFLPLTTGVMFLLALPFVFGPQRNNSQGKKLFIGILIGLAYFIAYTSIANIILLTGVPVILGAALPILIFAFISLILLKVYG